ncbi:MAG TPA: pantoate--beta-alanine ligase [Nitrospirae bacterium]|nr:pantothenate synthetase [bacterium BMS3Bbin09]HDO66923.1 pantoate--beta-alanine ligase [Nitrospirota bacterium]HEW81097.1 pantoate--beta-alanine ligase [Nitrospirota bacterium]
MQVITTIKDMNAFSKATKAEGKNIGFAPTMGALHKGHISLIGNSVEQNDVTVVSIFVNPTQFGPTEDFNKYPKDHKGDMKKLSNLDVTAVFLPDVAEIYPKGFSTFVYVGGIGCILCGASRPDHFNGVATIVTKLFNIVMPDRAYFGQKDYQQTVVIKKIVRELAMNIDIVVCPIVREDDGLAMSSRNAYLSDEERNAALILNKALEYGKGLMLSGREEKANHIKEKMGAFIKAESLVTIEYVEIVGPVYLENIKEVKTPAVILLAAKVGTTRLIDNMIVE